MNRKGISPLIAAVLLIAFTMAVAAILTAWVTTFTQDTTGSVGNQSERLIECSFGGLSIYDVSTSGGGVVVSVANTGTRQFSNDVVITAFDNNGSAYQTRLSGLDTGEVDSSTNFSAMAPGGTNDLDEIKVSSVECPEISDSEVNFD